MERNGTFAGNKVTIRWIAAVSGRLSVSGYRRAAAWPDDVPGDIHRPGQHGNDYWPLAEIGAIFGNLPLGCARVPGPIFPFFSSRLAFLGRTLNSSETLGFLGPRFA